MRQPAGKRSPNGLAGQDIFKATMPLIKATALFLFCGKSHNGPVEVLGGETHREMRDQYVQRCKADDQTYGGQYKSDFGARRHGGNRGD
jgi:hypothetical protein